ncbi:MAG: DUF4494 domain-containing protein [Bacteroidales bacterium]|nr:DUF4494 domain-containing protein [Bacteroidales bacterium]
MLTLFECKIRYMKPDERSGKDKRVTEAYLFDAITYTEAEERVYKEMPQYISGEFAIASIRKAKYAEVLPSDDGDRWYKVKISFLMVDEASGREKRVSQMILVLASDVKDAVDKTIAGMNGDTDDFEVNMVMETAIMDFFPLFDKDKLPEDKEVGRREATPEDLENLPKLN